MGDYYKIKKILLICMIVLTILRIFKGSSVFATEAVEVTPTWNDGNYTNQSDNNYLTLMNNQLEIQERIIINLLYNLDHYRTNDLIRYIGYIRQRIGMEWNGSNNRFVWFGLVTDNSVNAAWFYQEVSNNSLGNIVFNDATLNNGYKITNVPFFSFSRSGVNGLYYFQANGTMIQGIASGTALVPCAECGYYSPRWVEVFEKAGLISSTQEYEDILDNLQGTQNLIYQQEISQSYYAEESYTIQSNTYNYLQSTSHTDETSMPFQTITANDPYDFTDFLDNLENILTNENYVSKQFTLTLPNNRSFNFSINPNMTEQLLTRIGGENVFGLITIMWYMGIYGIIIFDFKRMLNQILSGDWMNITTDSSPIDNVVSASFNATGATSTSTSHSGGDR